MGKKKGILCVRKIEDCITLEASWHEPEGSLFLSLNLSGLDTRKEVENLFDKRDEEFNPFEFSKRD